jgi:RNA polymerase sigma factor (sigma-70 family)
MVIDWVRARRGRPRPAGVPNGSDEEVRPKESKAGRVRPLNVHLSPEMGGQLAGDECPPDEQLIQEHQWQMRRHILEKVKAELQSAQKWECFMRRYLEGKPSSEVAAELGLSISAVDTNTSRVRARIRELCSEYDVEL